MISSRLIALPVAFTSRHQMLTRIVLYFVTALLAISASPVFAQTNFSGNEVREYAKDLQKEGLRQEQADKIAGIAVVWLQRAVSAAERQTEVKLRELRVELLEEIRAEKHSFVKFMDSFYGGVMLGIAVFAIGWLLGRLRR